MTQQGAVLQGYNNELVKCIEDLCMQKEELNKQIRQAEEEKNKLQHEIQVLSEQLECVCENLAQKVASRNELDKILAETEAAYMKILDSSRTLLNVLKKEVGSLKHSPDLKTNVTWNSQMFGLSSAKIPLGEKRGQPRNLTATE